MNQQIKELIENGTPKLNLEEKEAHFHKFGLLFLASIVCDDFLDLALLPDERFDTDGLFYTIPYLHSETLGWSGQTRTILVVWKVENKSSFCPLRIDVEMIDKDNYSLYVFDQSGERTIKKSLISKENGTYYTEIEGHNKRTLSQLVANL